MTTTQRTKIISSNIFLDWRSKGRMCWKRGRSWASAICRSRLRSLFANYWPIKTGSIAFWSIIPSMIRSTISSSLRNQFNMTLRKGWPKDLVLKNCHFSIDCFISLIMPITGGQAKISIVETVHLVLSCHRSRSSFSQRYKSFVLTIKPILS